MLELAIVVCLLDNPGKCKDESLTFSAETLTQFQCMVGAPIEIAKWNERRPRWYAKKWTCRPAGQIAKI